MASHEIDPETWERAQQYRHFRRYQRPHFSITTRLDVSHLVTVRKPRGESAYRATVHAVGTAVHAVPELRTRFRGDRVVQHDDVALSMTVPLADDNFVYAHVLYQPDPTAFDNDCRSRIEAARRQGNLDPGSAEDDAVVYLSCAPWLDFSAASNPIAGPDDCIPRIVWGRIIEDFPGKWRMPMALEAHHALMDGAHAGKFFERVQSELNRD